MAFVKATKKKSKLRLALTGPSGSGKTWGALQIAKGLGGRIACIDTEKGSASLYEHIVDFDVLELSAPYTPERYIEAIKEAEKAGYDTLIIDSTSHEWSGPGGCLEIIDEVARAKFKGNTWSAWSDVTPRHRAFVDTMTQCNMHIISTGRSKTETAQSENNGRKTVVKLGMKTEQRDGFEFEFTVVLDIIHDGHFATASKDRTGLFTDKDPKPLNEETGKMLADWLNNGTEPTISKADAISIFDELKHAGIDKELFMESFGIKGFLELKVSQSEDIDKWIQGNKVTDPLKLVEPADDASWPEPPEKLAA